MPALAQKTGLPAIIPGRKRQHIGAHIVAALDHLECIETILADSPFDTSDSRGYGEKLAQMLAATRLAAIHVKNLATG